MKKENQETHGNRCNKKNKIVFSILFKPKTVFLFCSQKFIK